MSQHAHSAEEEHCHDPQTPPAVAGRAGTTTYATLHCLLGCGIGELLGLMIGTLVGLGAWATMGLATALAFIVGLNLAVLPVMRRHGASYSRALATVWVGEVASIAAMEIAINAVDYWVGGVQAGSLLAPVFWIGFVAALPAGFVAAWPINWWLVGRNLKHCH